MRRRFFVDQFQNQRASMHGEAAHHLGRVLRAQPGQLYELSDGSSVWLGRIDTVTRDEITFELLEQLAAHRSSLETSLLLAVVKFDSFEWALEKATELGVSRIIPLAAARSEKALLAAAPKRAGRWQKILLESSQQSRRVQLPTLDPLTKPEAAFANAWGGSRAARKSGTANLRGGGLKILLSESPEATPLRPILSGVHECEVVLAIGPEGGWTDSECSAARAGNFHEASLGNLILRTETAVVAALAALNFALATP
jgi:16S rRNA (uracil1498-N3)-methyltransferase